MKARNKCDTAYPGNGRCGETYPNSGELLEDKRTADDGYTSVFHRLHTLGFKYSDDHTKVTFAVRNKLHTRGIVESDAGREMY